MEKFFQYNWQVRGEWFGWCKELPEEELFKKRIGGLGNIYHTLLHIIEVEKSWIHDIKGEPVEELSLETFRSVDDLIAYSDQTREQTIKIIMNYKESLNSEPVRCPTFNGSYSFFAYGEILRHLIAHEIHHIGQLSVWAREIGKPPITANLINRGLFELAGKEKQE